MQNKPGKWLLVILICIFLMPILHIYNSFNISPRINNLNQDIKILETGHKLSADVTNLISSTRTYILHPDSEYLDEINTLIQEIKKSELNLRNKSPSSQQEQLDRLLKQSREYISFIENEIIPPARNAEEPGYSPVVLNQHEKLGQRLVDTADNFTDRQQQMINKNADNILALEKEKSFFSFVFLLLFFTMIGIGSYKFFLPVLRQFVRLNILNSYTRYAILITNEKGNIKSINKATEYLFHVNSKEIEDKPLNEVTYYYPYLQNMIQPLSQIILEPKTITGHQTVLSYNDDKIFYTVDYYPLYEEDKLIGTAMIAHPEEIHSDKKYLFETIEAERKKISIEIHDWIGRNMSPIIHSLDYILHLHAKKLPEDARSDLTRLREHCQNAAADMRGIMNDIHPYLIDKAGLIPALEAYMRNFEQTSNIKVYLYYQDRSLELEKTTEIVIYRIIQEALSNVTKHSDAGEVDIHFSLEEDNTLKVEITDNGTPKQKTGEGKELWSMRERANLVGGDIVHGPDESGYTVILTIPLTPEGN